MKAAASSWRVLITTVSADAMRMFARAGWPAVVGLGLIAFALAYEYSGNQATREHIAQINEQRSALHEQARHPAKQTLSAREQLTAFYQRFPGGDALHEVLPDVLLRLHQLAKKQGLSPLRADYRDSPEPNTPLLRVSVSIPVSGSYKAVRAWLDEVMKTMPEVALDGLEVSRNDIGTDQVAAQVRFIVMLRDAR